MSRDTATKELLDVCTQRSRRALKVLLVFIRSSEPAGFEYAEVVSTTIYEYTDSKASDLLTKGLSPMGPRGRDNN